LPTDEFRFVGFLPAKTVARRKVFEEMHDEQATVVAYESPHRILECLADMDDVFGERPIVLARELTKIHEEFLRGAAAQIRAALEERGTVKGEITLVIGRAPERAATGDAIAEVAKLQAEGVERMEAIKLIAKRMGLPKRAVYRLAVAPGNNPPDKRRG
jgi:16S rRNA (cytidine1402-2'-O)-methyltransferase